MHLIPLRRKIIKIEIDRKELSKLMPGKIMKALDVLALEKSILIKGGLAKIVLNEILKNEGKIRENRALKNTWEKEPDIDLILTYSGTKTKNLPRLTEKVSHITAELAKIGFELNNRDIELVKGSLTDEKVIKKILESRDITINELILIPRENGTEWLLYHTDKCLRDTLRKTGISTPNNPATVRFNYGRLITIFYGINRMLRFFIEGKVDSIYLPARWIDVNNQTAAKENRPKLGVYGLILARRYVEFPKLQKKFMRVLKDLNLAEEENFKDYLETRENWFKQSTGKQLNLNKDAPFEKVQESVGRKKERHLEKKHERKQLQENCSHYIEQFTCSWCPQQCLIKHCQKCDKLEITPKKSDKPAHLYELFCNKKFIAADFEWDEKSFYPKAPEKPENKE